MSLAPIFPKEAVSRGVEVPLIGTIYAMYSVSNTLVVPFVGYNLHYGRRKFVLAGFICLFASMCTFSCI